MKTSKLNLLFGFFGAALLTAALGFPLLNSQAQTARPVPPQQEQRPRQTQTPPVQTQRPPALASPTPPPATPTPNGEVIDDGDEPIRVESNLVNLSVRVVDRNGLIQSDVRAEEFKVLEDGVPQKIEFVSREEVPVNYGMLVDNSGSLRPQLEKVIESGKILVGANKPGDEAFLIRFVSSDKIEVPQDWTSDKTLLSDALEEMYIEGGSTAIIDAVMLAAEKATEYEKSTDPNDRKRRALILITDGEDRASYYKEEQLFARLREADVQIYPIGFVNELGTDKSLFGKSDKGKAVGLLERLAKETGGKAYFPNSVGELPQIAQDITKEMRTQYIVSYAPTNEKRDGTFRAIKVQVNDDARRGKRIALTRSGRNAPKS